LPAPRRFILPRHSERFVHPRHCLRDMEGGIAFPARIDVQFPLHARQRRADQFVIDLFRNGPTLDVDLLPARCELSKIFALLVDGSCRPIASSARAFDPIYVIVCKWRILSAPRPKIASEFVESFRFRVLRRLLRARATQHEHNRNSRSRGAEFSSAAIESKHLSRNKNFLACRADTF